MGQLAVVLGSNALSPQGRAIADVAAVHGATVLQRHGADYRLPHEIDHLANLEWLAEQGCDRVLAIGSVGSLHVELPVGSLVCPNDFIALHLGVSGVTGLRAHAVPGFDPGWRQEVIEAWNARGNPLRDGGVYWQTIGPRFETPAEIRMMAAHADLVGMTIAAECIVAGDLGLAYAAVCAVDNLANGVASEEMAISELEIHRDANATRLRDGLDATLSELER
ncbi:MAG TPA: MTAP family purine nucleoside phosphorylase [Solirubrobacterales bacterium]